MQWITITHPLIHSKNVIKSSFTLCSVLLLFIYRSLSFSQCLLFCLSLALSHLLILILGVEDTLFVVCFLIRSASQIVAAGYLRNETFICYSWQIASICGWGRKGVMLVYITQFFVVQRCLCWILPVLDILCYDFDTAVLPRMCSGPARASLCIPDLLCRMSCIQHITEAFLLQFHNYLSAASFTSACPQY